MNLATFAMVLCAAILHAGWNLAVKAAPDRLVAAWSIFGVGGLIGTAVMLSEGAPARAALGWWALSTVLHVGYAVALSSAYEHADLAVAYPVARGMAPLLVAIGGMALFGDEINRVEILGIAVICAGLVTMMRRGHLDGYAWAVLAGLFIAGYTISDGGGVRADGSAARFMASLFVTQTALLTMIVWRSRGPAAMGQFISDNRWRVGLGGAAGYVAYLLVLIAARTSPLGLVSGIRETSTVFGALGAKFFFDEEVATRQAIAIVSVLAGAALILAGSS